MRPLSPTLREWARKEVNETPERIDQDLQILREWIGKQRHLRARTSDDFLIAFLRRCQYSLEETKKRIDRFFSFYQLFPEVFRNRTVTSRVLEINRLGVHYYPEFPKCNDNSAILIARFGRFDPVRYNVKEIFQFIMMAAEIITLENDYASISGVCQVLDLKHVCPQRLEDFDSSIFDRYWTWVLECSPLRIREVYIINAPKDMYHKLNFAKKWISAAMKYPVYVLKSPELLHEYIPKCSLPEEYGGTNGHVAECVAYMDDLLRAYRDYFDEDALYGCSEELRAVHRSSCDMDFGLDGSFRKLPFD